MDLLFIQSGKANRSALIERFNRNFRGHLTTSNKRYLPY